jgi:hypothetical protein
VNRPLTASTGSLVNPFQYTARESDSETGLYYYRARYYDGVGRRRVEFSLDGRVHRESVPLRELGDGDLGDAASFVILKFAGFILPQPHEPSVSDAFLALPLLDFSTLSHSSFQSYQESN